MKYFLNPVKFLPAAAIMAIACGCATTSKSVNRQDLLTAAGFKIITPSKPDQRVLLTSLPADKVTPITYHGTSYYVFPDVANNRAFVGTPQQYQYYRATRSEQKLSNDNIEAARWNTTVSTMDGWNGWGDTPTGGH